MKLSEYEALLLHILIKERFGYIEREKRRLPLKRREIGDLEYERRSCMVEAEFEALSRVDCNLMELIGKYNLTIPDS